MDSEVDQKLAELPVQRVVDQEHKDQQEASN